MLLGLWVLAADPGNTGGNGSTLMALMPFLLILVVAWFLFVLPNRRQEKQRQAMVAALKKNDKIVNSGGIIGIVESIKEKDDEIVLKGGLRITKSSVQRVLAPDDGGKEQK